MSTPERSLCTELLLTAAQSMGATVESGALQLTGPKFNSEVLGEAISHRSVGRHDADLPHQIAAVQLDGIPVLVGELGGAAIRASVEPQLRRYRNQALIARSWLGAEAPNLQLFLAGPPGALADGRWRQLAAEIEADDRICRKLVWLFEDAPTVRDAQGFLERTFVAKPWPTEHSHVKLDLVADYSLPYGWEEVLDDPLLDYDGLVEQLIDLEREATK
jgi:hypothetical protein